MGKLLVQRKSPFSARTLVGVVDALWEADDGGRTVVEYKSNCWGDRAGTNKINNMGKTSDQPSFFIRGMAWAIISTLPGRSDIKEKRAPRCTRRTWRPMGPQ